MTRPKFPNLLVGVLLVFLVSLVPLSLAQGVGEKEGIKEIKEIKIKGINKVSKGLGGGDEEEKVGEENKEEKTEIKKEEEKEKETKEKKEKKLSKEIKEIKKEIKNNLKKAKEGLEKAKKKYSLVKQRYREAREKYLEAKKKVKTLKEELVVCKGIECAEKKKLFREESKKYLFHLTEVIPNLMDMLSERITISPLSEEEKTSLLEALAERKDKLEEAKEILAKAEEEITEGELKEAIQLIKGFWQWLKPKARLATGKMINAKLGNILVKIERLEERFEQIKLKLEEEGYDISDLVDYLEEYEAKLNLAKENWELAKEKFQEAEAVKHTERKKFKELMKDAHDYQKKAREQVKEIKKIIKEIIKEIKERKGEVAFGGDEEEEKGEGEKEEEATELTET